jgi:hypothetical protein
VRLRAWRPFRAFSDRRGYDARRTAILGEPTIDQLIAKGHVIEHVMFDADAWRESDVPPAQAKKSLVGD